MRWALVLLAACYDAASLPPGQPAEDAQPSDTPPDVSLAGCPTTYGELTGGRYRLDQTQVSWFIAEELCAQDEATATAMDVHTHLAVVTSPAEQDALGTLSSDAFWIGYSDLANEGAWQHITAESSEYPGSIKGVTAADPWNIGEPNGTSSENCAIVRAVNGLPKLDDRPCNDGATLFRFVCECDAFVAMPPGG